LEEEVPNHTLWRSRFGRGCWRKTRRLMMMMIIIIIIIINDDD
jgi:hypothetical protein